MWCSEGPVGGVDPFSWGVRVSGFSRETRSVDITGPQSVSWELWGSLRSLQGPQGLGFFFINFNQSDTLQQAEGRSGNETGGFYSARHNRGLQPFATKSHSSALTVFSGLGKYDPS